MRWNTVWSKYLASASATSEAAALGADSGSRVIVNSPQLVVTTSRCVPSSRSAVGFLPSRSSAGGAATSSQPERASGCAGVVGVGAGAGSLGAAVVESLAVSLSSSSPHAPSPAARQIEAMARARRIGDRVASGPWRSRPS
jgi:hypothetical protein